MPEFTALPAMAAATLAPATDGLAIVDVSGNVTDKITAANLVNATLGGGVAPTGGASAIVGDIDITGDFSVTGAVSVTGDVAVTGDVDITGAASLTGQLTSTLATGTAPLVVASTTLVANLNAAALGGKTFAAPAAIGTGTPAAITGTTITATGAFGCNAATAQTAAASGGALASYSTGAFGLDSDANMHALYTLVVNMRAALVANGILS